MQLKQKKSHRLLLDPMNDFDSKQKKQISTTTNLKAVGQQEKPLYICLGQEGLVDFSKLQ